MSKIISHIPNSVVNGLQINSKSIFTNILLGMFCLYLTPCLSQDVSQKRSDNHFLNFVSKFQETNLPLKIKEDEQVVLNEDGANLGEIDLNCARGYLLPDSNDSSGRYEWSQSYYGYKIITNKEFLILTHVEHLAACSIHATNYLTTFTPNGQILSQIVIGEEYDGMVGGIKSGCSIDKDFNIIFIREEYEYDVETDEEELKNDKWQIKYKISNEGFIERIDSIKIQDANWRYIPNNHTPCFSPDDRFVAFISDRSPLDNIWLMDVITNDKRQITNVKYSRSLDWCPDGKSITFQSRGQRDHGPLDIWRVFLDDSNTVNLTNSPDIDDKNAQWSPCGDKIVWSRGKKLWIMDKNGENAQPLTANPPSYYESCRCWAPDGKRIIYKVWEYTKHNTIKWSELRVMNSDGTNHRKFNEWKYMDRARWAGSGHWIYYCTRDALWRTRPDNYRNKELVLRMDWFGIFDWDISHDDHMIVYSDSELAGLGKIYIVPIKQ